ncbi:aggrecan core protein-like [Mercenaria mercenaria]|uniref:aggrecan core protein-like n=1 Tax=Mercenaria mercenaria TaxID=6596 RepID=UPI00234ED2B8|nr:aggrecan core protein-like [Mercenaria mercenaria]
MLIFSIIGITLCVLSLNVYAEYNCLCNYRVETEMHGAPSENSSPVGYMYEFDCKPAVSTNKLEETWFAIMNEHLTAYVKTDSGLQMQVCPGSIPEEDKLFTSTKQTSTSTTTTSKPTTTSTTKTTLKPSTTSTTTPTLKPSTTNTTTTTPKPSTSNTTTTTPKPTTTSTTTTKPKRITTTTTPKPTTITSTPKPTTTMTTTTTPKPTTTRTTKQKTSGTHSTTARTKHTCTTSGWSTTSDWLFNSTQEHTQHFGPYTTKKHHIIFTQHWLRTNGNHQHLFTIHLLHKPHLTHGNLNLCPGILIRSKDAKWLRQFKSHCYELVHNSKNWYDAETDCWNRLGHGGELLEIYTEDIQNFIMNFLREVGNHRFLWIGLQDIDREEHFAWDSGVRLTYSNWNPNRKNNHLQHKHEDCVMLQNNGLWDDSLCSHDDLQRRFLVNANNVNVRRPYICQYPTHNSHHG